MDIYIQGVGRLGHDVVLTDIIRDGKPERIVLNSIAVYTKNNGTVWIDCEVPFPYSLKFVKFFKKGERLQFAGYLKNFTKTKENGDKMKLLVLNVTQAEHLK